MDEIMQAEWDAWRNVVKELTALGLDIDRPKCNPFVDAVRLWGERLSILRRRQTLEKVTKILTEAETTYTDGR